MLYDLEGLSSTEILHKGILNIVTYLSDALTELGNAFDDVFGDAKSRGEGVRGWMVRFYELTSGIEMTEDRLASIRSVGVKFFSFFKNGLSDIGKGFRIIRKAFSLTVKLIGDLGEGISRIFTGKFSLNENLEETHGVLGKVFGFISKIFEKIKEYTKDFSLLDFLEKTIDKIDEIRSRLKGGETLASIFGSKDGEENVGILGKFREFFGLFQKDTEGVADSVDKMASGVSSLSGALGTVSEVGSAFYEGIFGDPEKFKEKARGFWKLIKETIFEEYNKINWDTAIDVGRLGLVGFLVYRLQDMFKTVKKTIANTPTSFLGILQSFVNKLTSPLTELSMAIKKDEATNRYLKIAGAIAILAGSIYLLTAVDEDKFFNVAVTLGALMGIMAVMAKNVEGFQLFSNNNKTISKNNPISNAIHVFDQLKSAISFDFTNANLSLLPKTMGTLLGAASLIVSVVYAIMKLKDVAKPDQIKELIPTFIILGSVFTVMAVFVAVLAAFTEKSKYLGKSGFVMLSLAASVILIVNAIRKMGEAKLDGGQWINMWQTFLMIIVLLGVIGGVLYAAGKLTNQGQSAITSGSAVWGVAAVVLAIALMVKSLVKTMEKASKIENLKKGLAIVAGLLLALVTVFAIMSAIVSYNKMEPAAMLKMAASMVVLALALAILVPAIMLMSFLPAAGLIAAAGALGILVLAMSGAVLIMSKLEPKKMIITAAAFAIIATSMAVMIGVLGALTLGFLAFIVMVPWDTLEDKFDAFKKAMDKILPTLLSISVIVLIAGIGFAFLSVAAGVMGLSFLVVSAGLFLVAAALVKFGESLTAIGQGLPNFVNGLVEVFDTFKKDGWKVLLVVVALAAAIWGISKAIKGINLSSIGEKLQSEDLGSKMIKALENIIKALKMASPQLIKAIMSFAGLAITALILLIPFTVDKIVHIIVTVITSLASALNKQSDSLIGALTQLFKTLVNIAFKAFVTVISESLDLFWNFIIEMVRSFGGDRLAKALENFISPDAFEGFENKINAAADRALEKSNLNDKKIEVPVAVSPQAEIQSITESPEFAAMVQDYQSSVGSLGTDTGTTLGNNTVSAASEAIASGGADGTGFVGGIQTLIGNATSSIDTGGLKEAALGSFSEAFGGEETLGVLGDLGLSDGTSLVGGMAGYLTGNDAGNGMKGAASSLFSQLGNQYNSDAETGTQTLGHNTVVGLFNKIVEKAKEYLPRAGSYMYSQVDSGYRSASDQQSPSKEMMKNGMYTLMGLAKGLIQNAGLAYDAADDVGSGLMSEFRQAMEKIAILADEDLTVTPTITPIVDLSNVEAASGMVTSTFGNGYTMSAQMTGTINRRMNEVERIAANMQNSGQTINNGDNIVINVYPSQGMDEEALANMVMDRMQTRMVRRSVAFG